MQGNESWNKVEKHEDVYSFLLNNKGSITFTHELSARYELRRRPELCDRPVQYSNLPSEISYNGKGGNWVFDHNFPDYVIAGINREISQK